MRLKVPMTGTVIDYDPKLALLDGQGIKGDPNDPVGPIPLNLNVAWQLVSVDMQNELMEIEVSPPQEIDVDTGSIDSEGKPIYARRPTTAQEKLQILNDAKNFVESKTIDEFYSITKAARLKKTEKVKAVLASVFRE